MRDMDRALTMNPTMAHMDDIPHWVDRSVWTETLSAAGAVDYRRPGALVAASNRPKQILDIRT